jgi:hypothetical protein
MVLGDKVENSNIQNRGALRFDCGARAKDKPHINNFTSVGIQTLIFLHCNSLPMYKFSLLQFLACEARFKST